MAGGYLLSNSIVKRNREIRVADNTKSGLWIDDIAPIKVAAVEAVNQRLRRCNIGCNRDVVHVAQAKQVGFVGLMRLGAERIAEKQE